MQRPTPYPENAFRELRDLVSPGQYASFQTQTGLPSAISRIAGGVPAADFRFAIVAASATTSQPPSLGGITPAPNSTVVGVSIVRADYGNPNNPHFNRDQVLLFEDPRGHPWQLHRKDLPNHFIALSRDSGLSAALDVYQVANSRGAIRDLFSAHAPSSHGSA